IQLLRLQQPVTLLQPLQPLQPLQLVAMLALIALEPRDAGLPRRTRRRPPMLVGDQFGSAVGRGTLINVVPHQLKQPQKPFHAGRILSAPSHRHTPLRGSEMILVGLPETRPWT